MPDFLDLYNEALTRRGLNNPGVTRASTPAPRDYLAYYNQRMARPMVPRGVSVKPAQRGDEAEAYVVDDNTHHLKQEGPSDPVSWIIDILSRGMYAGATTATNIGRGAAEGAGTEGNIGGGILGGLGGLLKSLAPVDDSAHEAFWGSDPNLKRTFSDSIEEVTDAFGANDPNYVDLVDNVDPALKGPVGLAGDIFLDPTTYIPGAVLAKGVSVPARLAWKGGAALPEAVAGKAIPEAVRNVPGLRALGYKEGQRGVNAYEAEKAAVEAARATRVADEGGPTPTGPGSPGPTGPTAPPGRAPGTSAPPPPRPGAVGVAERATPSLNPLGKAVNFLANLGRKNKNRVDDAVTAAEAKAAAPIADVAAGSAKGPTAFDTMTAAEERAARSQRAQAEAERLSAQRPQLTPSSTGTPQRQTRTPEQQRKFDEEWAKRYPDDAPKPAESTPPDAASPQASPQPKAPAPTPQAPAPKAPPVVARDPLPEGAMADLEAKLNGYVGKPALANQAKLLVKHAGVPLKPEVVRDMLKREAGVGKPLTPSEQVFLGDLRHEAARGMHDATTAALRESAERAASAKHDKVVQQAGAYTSMTDLHDLVVTSTYIDRVRKFLLHLQKLMKEGERVHPAPRAVIELTPKGREVLKGKITAEGGSGLFDPKYSQVRQNAMHLWLQADGPLAKSWGNEKMTLDLGDGLSKDVSVAEMRALVERLTKSENDEVLTDAVLGNSFRGPADLSVDDGLLLQAIWREFYDSVQTGSVSGEHAILAFKTAHAADALQYAINHDFEKLGAWLGESVAEGLAKTAAGNNLARLGEQFKAFVQIANPAFSADQLSELLRRRAALQVPGQGSIMDPVMFEAGFGKEHLGYLATLKLEHEALQANAVPTPPKAIPADVDPAVAEVISAAPSSVNPHPIGPEAVLERVRAAGGEGQPVTLQSATLQMLARVFKRDVLDPQGLDVTTKTGVKLDSTLPDRYGYRPDLWNAPKQVEVFQQIHRVLEANADELLKAETDPRFRIYDRMKPDPKLPDYKKPDGSINWKQKGTMPYKVRLDWEWAKTLEALKIADEFMADIGIRQVIGHSVDDAIPLSVGDMLSAIDTKLVALFGKQASEVRNLMFIGAQKQGAGKVNPSNMLEAFRLMLSGEPKEAVIQQLLSNRLHGYRGGLQGPTTEAQQKMGRFDLGQNPNNWNNPQYHEASTYNAFGDLSAWQEHFPNAVLNLGGKGKQSSIYIPGEDLAEAMYRLMEEALPSVGARAINNDWRGVNAALEGADEVIIPKMTQDIFVELAKDPTKLPELIRALDDMPNTARAIARENTLYPVSADLAVEKMTAQAPEAVADSQAAARIADAETPGAGTRQNLAERYEQIRQEEKAVTDDVQDAAVEVAQESQAEYLLNNPEARAAMADIDNVPDAKVEPATPQAGGGGRGAAPPTPPKPPSGGAGGGTPTPKDPRIEAAEEVAIDLSDLHDIAAPYHEAYLNLLGRRALTVGRWFNASLGMKGMWQGLHAGGVLANSRLAQIDNAISELSKKYTKDEITAVFREIQSGVTPTGEREIADRLNNHLNLLWATTGELVLGHSLLSVDPVISHLNNTLRKWFPETGPNARPEFKIDEAHAAVKAGQFGTVGEALASQWKAWPVEDAADFMSRMMSAAMNVAEHRAVVSLFERNLRSWGGVSDVPLPGWAKPKATGESSFIHFIDQDKFYPQELLAELHNADVFVTTSRQISGAHGRWVRNVYSPWLNAWKRGMTVNRPGHHLRNLFGDAVMTYTIRGHGKSAEAGADAFRIMAVAGQYEDLDFVRMFDTMHEPTGGQVFSKHPSADDVLTTFRVNGEHVEYTVGRASDAQHRHGLRPSYHLGEGLYENPEMLNWFTKLANKASLEGTRYGKFMGRVSQGRDHWARTQHFMQIIRQETTESRYLLGGGAVRKQFAGKWKTLDELEALAAREVKKYHPDSSMLTTVESKYLRMIFPFYSWMSKIMPAFFESFLRNPGRVMILPKASYETAVMAGLNPDSIYDPFPTEGMYPSYITNKALGPQFWDANDNAAGFNPGIPQMDLLNSFLGNGSPENPILGGANPLIGAAGMLTPALRIPWELATKASVGGVPIKDTSDYIDSQIPGGSYVAGITGYSPTSAVLGEGLWDEDTENQSLFQERRMVREGKYEGLLDENGALSGDAATSLLNWLFGFGLSGMGHVNQRNFAEIEQRNAG